MPPETITETHRSRKRAKRRVDGDDDQPVRRSTHACHRCQAKKLKCYYTLGETTICAPCHKAGVDCVYDVAHDGILRGADYIAALEARVTELEARETGDRSRLEFTNTKSDHRATANGVTYEALTIFNLVASGPDTAEREFGPLPNVPLPSDADRYFEAVFQHAQSVYCIVDWVKMREWHTSREDLWQVKIDSPDKDQIGAYFLCMVYAMGANLTAEPNSSSNAFYARALQHLHAPVRLWDLTTVQALLVLIQFGYRAVPSPPAQWSLVGVVMRLCVELGLHRKSIEQSLHDPYRIELQKRLFWCAYAFDRLVCFGTSRPFGINDLDIDAEVPVDVDVMCKEPAIIRTLQVQQATGEERVMQMTTMTSSLHLLRMYRLRSRIKTHFYGPCAPPPQHDDVIRLMAELDHWKESLPGPDCPCRLEEAHLENMYLQAALYLVRPMLRQAEMDVDLLLRCAGMAAKGCTHAKTMCLNIVRHPTPIQAYNCFNYGITLLQCLVISPTILPSNVFMRAISACSSALALYSRSFPSAKPFLEIFDKLSDRYFEAMDHQLSPDPSLRPFLGRVSVCEPSRMSELIPLADVRIDPFQGSPTHKERAPVNLPPDTPIDTSSIPAAVEPSNFPHPAAFLSTDWSADPQIGNLSVPFESFAWDFDLAGSIAANDN